MGPDPQWGEPQVNPIDNTFDQIANSWKVRVNHDYVFSPQLINHVTVSLDRYINRGQNKTFGQGWADQLGHHRAPRRRRLVPVDQLQRRHGVAGQSRPRLRRGLARLRLGRHAEPDVVGRQAHHEVRRRSSAESGVDRFFSGGRAGTFNVQQLHHQPAQLSRRSARGATRSPASCSATSSSTSAVIPVDTSLELEPLRAVRPGRVARDADPDALVRTALGLPAAVSARPTIRSARSCRTSPIPARPDCRARWRSRPRTSTRYGHSFQDNWYGGFGPRLGIGYIADAEDDPARLLGAVLQRHRQPELGDAGRLPVQPVVLRRRTTSRRCSTGTTRRSRRRSAVRRALDPSFANGQAVTYTPPDAARLPLRAELQRSAWRASWTAASRVDLSYIGSRSSHLALPANNSELNYVPLEYLALGNLLFQPITSAAAANAGFVEPFPGFANQLGANTVAAVAQAVPAVHVDHGQLDPPDGRRGALRLGAGQGDPARVQGPVDRVVLHMDAEQEQHELHDRRIPANARSAIDPGTPPHIFSFSWTYELPFGRDKTFLSGDSGFVSAHRSRAGRSPGRCATSRAAALAITATNNLVAARLHHQVRRPRRRTWTSTRMSRRLRSRDGSLPELGGVRRAGRLRAGQHRRSARLRARLPAEVGGVLAGAAAQRSATGSARRRYGLLEPVQLRALERSQHEHLVRRAVRVGDRHPGCAHHADQRVVPVLERSLSGPVDAQTLRSAGPCLFPTDRS